jgi:hypothetical protein
MELSFYLPVWGIVALAALGYLLAGSVVGGVWSSFLSDDDAQITAVFAGIFVWPVLLLWVPLYLIAFGVQRALRK